MSVDPPTRRSTAFLLLYAFAYAGGVIAYLPLLTLLLPLKIESLAGDTRIGVFTLSVSAGAIASSIANLLFGWLSDRSVARGRGRRGWLLFGMAATIAAFCGISVAASPLAIILAVAVFQIAVNALLAPLVAIMADEVPDAQKGVAGGLLAAASPVASGVSAILVALTIGEAGRLAIVAVVMAGCIVPLLLTPTQMAAATPAPAPVATPQRRDLATAWGARLLVQIAGNALSLYLLYYFESIVPDASGAALAPQVGHLLTIAYLLSLPIALAAGRWSDRIGRRKPVLLGGATLAAAGLAAMAAAQNWWTAATGFTLYAVGSAAFLTLHAAFAMQLLPDPAHRGRDLGVLNLTNTLPALLGPALAWALATPDDFGAVMGTLAVLTFAGGIAMTAIRSRR